MPPSRPGAGRSPTARRWLLAALAGLASLLAAAAAPAQPATPLAQARELTPKAGAAQQLSPGDLAELIATLENPEQRAELLAQLRALRAVRAGLPKPPPQPTPPADPDGARAAGRPLGGLIAGAREQTRSFRAKLAAQFRAPGPDAVTPARLAALWADPQRRNALMAGAARVLGTLAVAWLAAYGVHRALGRARARLTGAAAGRGWQRGSPPLAGRVLVALLGPLAFVAVALAGTALLGLGERAQAFLESLTAALAAGAFLQTLVTSVLTPAAAQARLLPVGDALAGWLHRWLRRAILLAVVGFVAGEALAILDYPVALAELARKIGGTAVVALAVAALWRARKPVAAALRPAASHAGPTARARRALAPVWHVLGIAYLVCGYTVWALDIPGGLGLFLQGSAVTLAAVLGSYLVGDLGGRFLAARLQPSARLAEQVPSLPARMAKLRPLVARLWRGLAYLGGAVAILFGWGLGLPGWLTGAFLAATGEVVFLLALFALAWEVLRSAIEWYLLRLDAQAEAQHRAARARTILPFLRKAGFIALATLAALSILLALGINVAPLVAGAGVIGIAIGFGAQTLVKDIITGLFMMVENQIEVGDWVALAGLNGCVEGLSIRTLQLRDLEGTVHIVPFSQVAEVSNYTRDYAYALVDAGFAYGEDLDRAVAAMEAVADEMAAEPALAAQLYSGLEIFGLERVEASAMVVRARIKVAPGYQWWLRREFLARLKKHCEAAGIEIPLPHTKLYFGEAKQGATPPARVALVDDSPPAASTDRPAADDAAADDATPLSRQPGSE